MHRGILKVVGREDKSALLPTGVAISFEGVEVRKEDGHIEGWDYCVSASPRLEEVQVRTWVAARRGAGLGHWEWNRCSSLPCGDTVAVTVFCGCQQRSRVALERTGGRGNGFDEKEQWGIRDRGVERC